MSVHDKAAEKEVKELLGIPEDEPIFILRGQDKLAPGAVKAYFNHAQLVDEEMKVGPEWFANVRECARDMLEYQELFPERVKFPD